jgi:hypothetical protein
MAGVSPAISFCAARDIVATLRLILRTKIADRVRSTKHAAS